jgi:hypothetical protein
MRLPADYHSQSCPPRGAGFLRGRRTRSTCLQAQSTSNTSGTLAYQSHGERELATGTWTLSWSYYESRLGQSHHRAKGAVSSAVAKFRSRPQTSRLEVANCIVQYSVHLRMLIEYPMMRGGKGSGHGNREGTVSRDTHLTHMGKTVEMN